MRENSSCPGIFSYRPALPAQKNPESKDSGLSSAHSRLHQMRCKITAHHIERIPWKRLPKISAALFAFDLSSFIQTLLLVPEFHRVSCDRQAKQQNICPLPSQVADYTASRELHPTPKNFLFVYVWHYNTVREENQEAFRLSFLMTFPSSSSIASTFAEPPSLFL